MVFRKLIGGLVGLAFLGMAGTANATPIMYSETVSGDLDNSQSFLFDVGANSVSGTTEFFVDPFSSDPDTFFFTIQSGQELISVEFSFSNLVSVGGVAFESVRIRLLDIPFSFNTTEQVFVTETLLKPLSVIMF